MSAGNTPLSSAPPSPTLEATTAGKRHHPLLARPLYAFQLPPTLLQSLTLRSIDVEPVQGSDQQQKGSEGENAGLSNGLVKSSAQGLVCSLCPSRPSFPDVAHQRAHFRSEWHRFNLQVMIQNGGSNGSASAPGMVDEKAWEELVNDLGEATDEEAPAATTDDETSRDAQNRPAPDKDLVSTLLAKLKLNGGAYQGKDDSDASLDEDDFEVDADGRPRRAVTAKSALLWFKTRSESLIHLEQTQLGVYRSLFPDPAGSTSSQPQSAQSWYTSTLQAAQALPLRRPPARGATKSSAWRGKRLKGMDEAAAMLGVSFLEGEGYLPGLVTKHVAPQAPEAEDEEDSDASDGDLSSSSDSADEDIAQASSSTSSSLSRPVDPPLHTWTVILFGGGHFSIAVVALNPYIAPRAASKNRPLPGEGSDEEILKEDRSIIVLAHKAFHRYTTRRKQGGSQAAQDASGKFAKSAGAQLRRAGEVALAEEVRALLGLSGYRKLIADSERVYVRASSRAARGILWTWPGESSASSASSSPLEGPRADGRMRTIPFSTRNKSTVGECLRVFAELTRVKITRRTEAELEEEDEAYRKSLAGSAVAREEVKKRRERERREREAALQRLRDQAKRKRGDSLSKDQRKERERLERMVDMVRRGRLEALINLINKHGSQLMRDQNSQDGSMSIDAPLPEWWRAGEVNPASRKAAMTLVPTTLLQLAAESAQEDLVQWLLVEQKANPTIGVAQPPLPANSEPATSQAPSEWPHRTAYDLLPPGPSSRGARNVFRRLYAQQPDWWNWSGDSVGGARVDSKLTEEMEGNQSKRRANMREKARAREKEREATNAVKQEQLAKEEAAKPAPAPTPAPASSTTSNRLGGAGAAGGAPKALRDAKDKMEGVTPEMKMRIEREKRARAAEERMKKLAQ
ncbi:unnamed protein product [Jaminaea pallidilutea]